MDISRLIDICIKVWPPKVTVVVNLFGEVHLPKDEQPKLANTYGTINNPRYEEIRSKLCGENSQ